MGGRLRMALFFAIAASAFCRPSLAEDETISGVHRHSMCSYGLELPARSPQAINAQKIAWDFVTKEKGWSPKPQPRSVVCDLVWILIVDYRPYNPTMVLQYVTIASKDMKVVQVFTDW